MRITHLRLADWRNFTGVDLDLGERLFILGPHAAGKSNLLDAIRFLRDVAAPGGGLRRAVAVRGGVRRIRALAAPDREGDGILLAVRLGDGEHPARLEYELRLAAAPRGPGDPPGRAVVVSERLWADDRDRLLVDRPDDRDRADPGRLGATALESADPGSPLGRAAGLLGSVRDMRLVPQVIREASRGGPRPGEAAGGDLLARLAATPPADRARRIAGITDALRMAVPQLADFEFVTAADGRPHLQARYADWRDESARQDETEFSDGTLRLIGLLWALQEGADGDAPGPPVLMEEPEMSLHPDVVRQLPSLFARAVRGGPVQVIATTHAAEILADEGLGLDEVLVLNPGPDGTTARRAAEVPEVPELVGQGFGLNEALREVLRQDRAEGMPLSGLL